MPKQRDDGGKWEGDLEHKKVLPEHFLLFLMLEKFWKLVAKDAL